MKKTKEEIIRHIKADQDIKNTAKNLKSSEEAVEVLKEMEKIIRSNKCSILWNCQVHYGF